MHVVLLCAGVGRRLAPYTEVRPKCLFEVQGVTLLERHLLHCQRLGARTITIVTGHLAPMLEEEVARLSPRTPVTFVLNERYEEGSIVSLQRGLATPIEGDVVFMDTDVLYHPSVLGKLFQSRHRSCVLVDATSEETGEEMMIGIRDGRAAHIARRVTAPGVEWELVGESVGFFRVAGAELGAFRSLLDQTITDDGPRQEYEAAVDRFFSRAIVGYERVDDLPWTEIDFAEDLRHAREDIAPRLPPLHEPGAVTGATQAS